MNTGHKAVWIVTTSALALGLAACNKPALQTSSTSPGATGTPPATSAQIDRAAPGAVDPMRAQVIVALNAEPGLAAINVEVNPADGTVTLTGTANNEENKTKASQIALNVPGVKSVQNNLVVKDVT